MYQELVEESREALGLRILGPKGKRSNNPLGKGHDGRRIKYLAMGTPTQQEASRRRAPKGEAGRDRLPKG